MNRAKSSLRSRGSSSSAGSNPRRRIRNCCRKFIAFMCTQVGVGGLIVGYAIVGALGFMSIESQVIDPSFQHVQNLRRNCALELYTYTEDTNIFNRTVWADHADEILRNYQKDFSKVIKKGYDGRTPTQIWSFPAALMFCLSVFTMIGYGNMVPRTQWGKGATVIYATFGIPLYILYFLNMGKVLAKSFKFLYTMIHECTHSRTRNISADEDPDPLPQKKIIVPSTACLWVISFYIFTGTVMFANWEKWSYLDSIYFCVTSLCKIGIGDFVPGTSFRSNALKDGKYGEVSIHKFTEREEQIKLAINFIYMLIGMGLVAMCYNLMREEVRVKMQEIKEDMRLCLEDLKDRFTICCGREDFY